MDKDHQKGLELGAEKFLMRPIEPLALVVAIEECLASPRGDSARSGSRNARGAR